MTRRTQLVILAAVLALFAAFLLWPRPIAGDVPIVAVPASMFTPLPAPRSVPDAAPSRTEAPTVVGTSNPGASPSPSASAAPVRLPAAQAVVPSASVTGLRTIASWMPERYGPAYLALPEGAGVRVRICGAASCIVLVSNDAGPALFMQREPYNRGVDLAVLAWEFVTGLDRSRGLAFVTVERMGGTP